MQQDTANRKPTILLLTHARTASHVLQRMLSKQPNVLYGENWFQRGRLQRRLIIESGPVEEIDSEIPKELTKLLEEGYSEFLEFLDDANRQDKIAFAYTQPHAMLKPRLMSDYVCNRWNSSRIGAPDPWVVGPVTQPHTNPTVVPDSVLLRPGTIPIINFCHPLLLCDRLIRGFRTLSAFDPGKIYHKMVILGGNLLWQRLMYEWYLEHGVPLGIEPILLDADDYVGPKKEALMRNLCDQVPGFDSNSLIYTWPKATSGELAEMPESDKQAYKTILASDGILPGLDMRGRNIDGEMAKWVDLWGQEDADFLRGLVEKAMPDYEFLMAHRMRPDGSSQ